MGVRIMEQSIPRREKEGYVVFADWHRLILGQVYLDFVEAKEKPPLGVVLRNLPFLLVTRIVAPRKIRALMAEIDAHPYWAKDSFFGGAVHSVLGLCAKATRKLDDATTELTLARRILEPYGNSALLRRVNAALDELV
jgi:hypothetical protein